MSLKQNNYKVSNIKWLTICFSILWIANNLHGPVSMNFDFEIPYGSNDEVGEYVKINGFRMYFERYGSGEPLLLIHGNGGDIRSMGNQIKIFKRRYQVIVADSRGHGKSGLSTDSLTYDQMAKDWMGLIHYLKLDSVNILGWSDGGIIGLLLGMKYNKVRRLVSMAANLRPDSSALKPYFVEYVDSMSFVIDYHIAKGDQSKPWDIMKQQGILMKYQPNILPTDLQAIKAPTLIISGDDDIIKLEHSIEIFKHLRNGQFCALPGDTHFSPVANVEVFNRIVLHFLIHPFQRPTSNWNEWK